MLLMSYDETVDFCGVIESRLLYRKTVPLDLKLILISKTYSA